MPSHATLTQREHAWPAFRAARMGLGEFQCRKRVPVDQVRMTAGLRSAPSIQHTVGRRVAVEVDAPADMPQEKPSSNALPRDWGGLGKIQGGRCVSVEQV